MWECVLVCGSVCGLVSGCARATACTFHQAIEPVCTVLFRSVENINMAKELPPFYYNSRSYVVC